MKGYHFERVYCPELDKFVLVKECLGDDFYHCTYFEYYERYSPTQVVPREFVGVFYKALMYDKWIGFIHFEYYIDDFDEN